MTLNLLKELHDIHHPAPIPLWPLAIGWKILMVSLLITIGIIVYLWLKTWERRRIKRIVLHQIELLQTKQNEHHNVAVELSILLKRAALACFSRKEVAGLYGEAWLQFLDKTAFTNEFTKGSGRLLIVSPYKGKNVCLPESLFHLIKTWVKKNL